MSKAEKKSDAVAETNSNILVVADAEARSLLAEAVVDMGAGAFDMDKIKLPSSGAEFFEVEGPNGTEALKELDVVIAAVRGSQKAWYRTTMDEGGGGAAPSCSSNDGVTGFGVRDLDSPDDAPPEEHKCSTCPWNQFGSSRGSGAGKDCSDSYHLIFYRLDAGLPDFMVVPAGSLKAVRSYLMRLLKYKSKPQSVVTRISLEATKNSTGTKFSRLVMTKLRDLSEPERSVFATLKEPCEAMLLK
jgi:hypothetical protein